MPKRDHREDGFPTSYGVQFVYFISFFYPVFPFAAALIVMRRSKRWNYYLYWRTMILLCNSDINGPAWILFVVWTGKR